MSRNIALVGFMGTGKTSVGKILAKRTGRALVDVDREVERREGRRIAEIFAADGEQRFRALEKAALREALAGGGKVITTGGGAVLDPENWEALREGAFTVALTATPETVHRRVRHSKDRPLLAVKDVLGEIRRLMDARRPLYAKADLSVATDGKTAAQVATVLLKELEGKL